MTIKEKYLKYLADRVSDERFNADNYTRLFRLLRETRFEALIELDENRIADAIEMRAEFEQANRCHHKIDDPISVLEIMVALAIRCEEGIMGNSEYGDRTSVWFWYMIKSLGLIEESDGNFDKCYCLDVIFTFIERKYGRDGEGGLFYIPDCTEDLTKVEIWYQMNWWLNTIGD